MILHYIEGIQDPVVVARTGDIYYKQYNTVNYQEECGFQYEDADGNHGDFYPATIRENKKGTNSGWFIQIWDAESKKMKKRSVLKLVWEAWKGPVKPGHRIHRIDMNALLPFSPDNLEEVPLRKLPAKVQLVGETMNGMCYGNYGFVAELPESMLPALAKDLRDETLTGRQVANKWDTSINTINALRTKLRKRGYLSNKTGCLL